MHKEKSHSVEERIVSISQSRVRPIVRGKVKTPTEFGADAIYRNRTNLQYCKSTGIRLSGSRLGRPPKVVTAAEKKQAKLDSRKRNEVEGAFGVTKRRYGLNLIMAKLQEISETVIALQFLMMNLERRLLPKQFF